MSDGTPEDGRRAGRHNPVAAVGGSALVQAFFLLLQILAYAVALAPCVPLVGWLVARLGPLAGWALGIALGFHVAGLVLALVVAALRALLGGRVPPGTYRLDSPQARKWLRNMAICEIARRSPLLAYAHHYSMLAALFYRLMGARVSWSARIAYGVRLTDPWLTTVGPEATIGEYALVLGHFIEGDSLVLAPVRVGGRATVGVGAVVAPGCTVGEGATLAASAMLAKEREVGPGEIWAGSPARRLPRINGDEPAPGEPPPSVGQS
jgi:acetyltransferase-like isoleucine patch superfamily enzyme